jgi:Fic-DOC domain mobile mystery protein B
MELFDEPEHATPLAPEEREGLKQHWVTTRNDLNIAEQDNILRGISWARRKRANTPSGMLNEVFILQLHKKMFGDVWQWAGAYRNTERNIGIEALQIPIALNQLFSDIRYWIEHNVFDPDETAVRFHHRLVSIHPFPNGNGRHSRLLADLLIEKLGGRVFTWGGGTLQEATLLRANYITALRAADAHDIAPLLVFARS